jgi:hypothetical protein
MEVTGHFHVPADLAPSTHSIGGWVGPSADLEMVAKENVPVPPRNRNPAVQPVALSLYWLSYPDTEDRKIWPLFRQLGFMLFLLVPFHVAAL